jgi:hypothetical protein
MFYSIILMTKHSTTYPVPVPLYQIAFCYDYLFFCEKGLPLFVYTT